MSYFLINSIPRQFHTPALRNFFKLSIQKEFFTYFHFRHRPSCKSINPISLEKTNRDESKSCALCVVGPEFVDLFHELYSNTHWFDLNGNLLESKCELYKLDEHAVIESIRKLPECNPPKLMPRGNVGTPESIFFELVSACKLPPSILKQLNIKFHGNFHAKNDAYHVVPPIMPTSGDTHDTIHHFRDDRLVHTNEYLANESYRKLRESALDDLDRNLTYERSKPTPSCKQVEDSPPEDWERFEALYDDPYNVERTSKANMKYEVKATKPWEKGGSGLVFYTDEQFWREEEPSTSRDEFFNEPTSFDVDVDLDHYDHEQRREKNFALREMQKWGWRVNTPLGTGSRQSAFTCPLIPCGQSSFAYDAGLRPGNRIVTCSQNEPYGRKMIKFVQAGFMTPANPDRNTDY